MKSVFRTDRGRIRTHNEDNGGVFYNSAMDCLAIVADGMGGHNAGDIASQITIESMQSQWLKVSAIENATQAEEWLKQAISIVNESILSHSNSHPECEGMGTTLVAAVCTSQFCTIANVGDSRCYVFNDSGFKQVTEDHSLVNALVKSGEISQEDAEHHPRKNVLTKALGTDQHVTADIFTILFEEDNYLLLCSDGLSNKLTQQEMEQLLQANLSLEEKADSFVRFANDNGGEDNITLVILEHSAGLESG